MFAYAGCYGKLLPLVPEDVLSPREFRTAGTRGSRFGKTGPPAWKLGRPTPMLRSCLLQLELYFNGCRSLKEKRRRLRGLRDRLGRTTGVAVCESGYQDSHQRSQWSVIAVASDAVVVERILAEVERSVQFSVDAELVGVQREWLR